MLADKEIQRQLDWILFFGVVFLVVIGIVMIYSATYQAEREFWRGIWKKQATWAIISLILLWVTVFIPHRYFYAIAYLVYGIAILSLFLVLVIGTGQKGATRWFSLGLFNLQPSEFAKISTVMALARYLSNKNLSMKQPREFIIPCLLIFLPTGLIIAQPDLGSALVFCSIFLPMLYCVGVRKIHLFFLVSPLLSLLCAFSRVSWAIFMLVLITAIFFTRPKLSGVIGLVMINLAVGIATPIAWDHLHDYQKDRIETFINPEHDPLGAGYQIIQSKVAIGSGGFLGKGFLNGTQTKLLFLPEQHTDFIFSVIGEELGFLGVSIILFVFALVIWRGLSIAYEAKNEFLSLTVVGLTSIFAFHAFVNVAMTIGLMPVVGIPLPFLSYGGSALLSNCIMIGFLLNVSLNKLEY